MWTDAMDDLIEFIRLRQINFALAGVLVAVYLVYQCGGFLLRMVGVCQEDDLQSRTKLRNRSRTRSRSRSRSPGRVEMRYGRRRREPRCPSCGLKFE